MKKKCLFLFAASTLLVAGCATPDTTPDNFAFPENGMFQGYTMFNGVDQDALQVYASTNDRIAVIVRDPSASQVSLAPRYQNSMVTFDGVSDCASLAFDLRGCSIYKFSFIGRGDTVIRLVHRNKGLNPRAQTFPSDQVLTIQAQVD